MPGFGELRVVVVGSQNVDVDAQVELARNLRRDLLGADVEDVRPVVSGSPPAGAKSGEAIALGALVVSLAPGLVQAVIDIVASWLRRQPSDIEVEIDGHRLSGQVTQQQREAIVAAYLDRVVSKKHH